jgi:hypothetical protein
VQREGVTDLVLLRDLVQQQPDASQADVHDQQLSANGPIDLRDLELVIESRSNTDVKTSLFGGILAGQVNLRPGNLRLSNRLAKAQSKI